MCASGLPWPRGPWWPGWPLGALAAGLGGSWVAWLVAWLHMMAWPVAWVTWLVAWVPKVAWKGVLRNARGGGAGGLETEPTA